MVKPLTQHLHLHYAIQRAIFQIADYIVFLTYAQLTMNDFHAIAALGIKRSDLLSVANRTSDSDELMAGTRLPQLLQFFQTVIHDTYIARLRQGNAFAKPLLVFHF